MYAGIRTVCLCGCMRVFVCAITCEGVFVFCVSIHSECVFMCVHTCVYAYYSDTRAKCKLDTGHLTGTKSE